jgi:hypothetical protein
MLRYVGLVKDVFIFRHCGVRVGLRLRDCVCGLPRSGDLIGVIEPTEFRQGYNPSYLSTSAILVPLFMTTLFSESYDLPCD